MTLYVCNILTQPGQTDGFKASDHLLAILRHFSDPNAKGALDHMLVQDPRVFETPRGRVWGPLLKRYRKEDKEQVVCDRDELNTLIPYTVADLVEEYQSDVMDRGVETLLATTRTKWPTLSAESSVA